jgi:hypothetical protein
MKSGGPPPILPLCLNGTMPKVPPPALDADGSDLIHVAFYDTRRKPNEKGMLKAAALFNSSRVRFHALLSYPQAIRGMRVHSLHLPPRARCIHRNLVRLSHGPGPQYLYKPLLHWVLPQDVERLIVLDTDVVMIRGIEELWAEFDHFGGAMLGVAKEQSNLYRCVSWVQTGGMWAGHCHAWRPSVTHRSLPAHRRGAIGANGGVQLLHLGRMRSSVRYAVGLDHYAAGLDGRWIGYLGDQTLYSFMGSSHPDLFYQLVRAWTSLRPL